LTTLKAQVYELCASDGKAVAAGKLMKFDQPNLLQPREDYNEST
jgi:hypothetical protein